jgi:hypothetical protein
MSDEGWSFDKPCILASKMAYEIYIGSSPLRAPLPKQERFLGVTNVTVIYYVSILVALIRGLHMVFVDLGGGHVKMLISWGWKI